MASSAEVEFSRELAVGMYRWQGACTRAELRGLRAELDFVSEANPRRLLSLDMLRQPHRGVAERLIGVARRATWST